MNRKNLYLFANLLFFPLSLTSTQSLAEPIKTPPEENPCQGVVRRMPIGFEVNGDSVKGAIVEYRKDIGDFRGAMWQGSKLVAVELHNLNLPEDGFFSIGFQNEKNRFEISKYEIKKGQYKNYLVQLKVPILFPEEQGVGMGVGDNARVEGATLLMDLSDWVCKKVQ
jgi:hypothetical protein